MSKTPFVKGFILSNMAKHWANAENLPTSKELNLMYITDIGIKITAAKITDKIILFETRNTTMAKRTAMAAKALYVKFEAADMFSATLGIR